MKALLIKEITSVFCSLTGAVFALSFLLIQSLMLWGFSGKYNLIEGGYASMSVFFQLSSFLLAFLIPTLTMSLFAEEKQNKTLDILFVRPVKILYVYTSKFLASFLFVLVTLLPTCIYVYSLWTLASPVGNIDLGSIVASYSSLMLLAAAYISIGLFGSAISKNQIIALIISVLLCLFSFYGFDLLSGLTSTGKLQLLLRSLGLNYHYHLMQGGLIQISDIITIINYASIFCILTLFVLNANNKRSYFIYIISLAAINILLIFMPNQRVDFTTDKRYTLSSFTIDKLKQIANAQPLYMTVYLDGDLNYGFQYLRNAVDDFLANANRYANGNIIVNYINPYQTAKDRSAMYDSMTEKGMKGILLNEVDREGKASQKIIYPYAQISNAKDTLVVSLLKNIKGNTADENLNISSESLEFEFADAIYLLNQQREKQIAFIEGHDEVERIYLYDAEEQLSRYYYVHRGQIGDSIGVLDHFDAIVVAGPLRKYNETEKYILDQYIMGGGKVLWFVDGTYYSHQELIQAGHSPSMKNDVNLDDMFFTYGVRINPDLIQDRQCISTYLVGGDQSQILLPSFYQPLLIPSPNNPITNNLKEVKAGFASSIDIVNNTPTIKKEILLTTSAAAHLVKVPEIIDFDVERIQNEPNYFDQKFLPVAVSLEGQFNSVYANRMNPDHLKGTLKKSMDRSKETKMIIVSSSDMISNEVQGKENETQVLPMGYDKTSNQVFGNRDFITNAVNWLTDDAGLMSLRTKQQKIFVLDKSLAYQQRNKYMILNTAVPLLFIVLLIGGIYLYRKNKYE